MTDYSPRVGAVGRNKKQAKTRWRTIIALIIVVALSFAIFSGFVKSVSFGKKIGREGWDGVSSYVAAIGDKPGWLFVFQKDPKKIALIKGQELLGDWKNSELTDKISVLFGSDIRNYIYLGAGTDEDFAKQLENFGSFTTPVKLLTGGWGSGDMHTNISRIDAFRLWW